jgi:cytochrome c oxidase assembly factor CtaG
VIEGTSQPEQGKATRTFRNYLSALGLLLLLLCYAPPFESWARRYEFAQAMQFAAFAVLIPALFVIGAPWRWLGLSSAQPPRVDDDGRMHLEHVPRLIDRHVLVRPHQTSNARAMVLTAAFVTLTVFWRTAPVVDFTVRHGWMIVFESFSTIAVGIALWSDLVESPPLSPGTTRPYRIGMSAVSMWTIWIVAYMDAMSHSSWYHVFHHVAGRGLSQAADQQFSAAAMWFLSAVAFMPVVFWNLVHWLQSEENPSDELNRLVRRERTLGP